MADYIRREDAMGSAKMMLMCYNADGMSVVEMDKAVEAEMSDLPSVDIVYCSECKYQHKLGGKNGWCDRAVVDAGDHVIGIVNADDDDYCSYGKREEQENEITER